MRTEVKPIRFTFALLVLASCWTVIVAAADFLPPPGVFVPESSWQHWAKAHRGQDALHAKDASQDDATYLNALVLERSPYLLQHANNPVNWMAWSEKSLALARSEDRLIFLSIGYSTCHWCHVMNRESFSDAAIAELMNRHFVAIKVDREELPVVDQHYSNTLAMVKGSAGWPLNAILDPAGNVILIESYLDPAALTKTLNRIVELARTRPEALEQSAQFIASLAVGRADSEAPDSGPLTLDELSRIADSIVSRMDPVHGGLAGQQKFPNEALLGFLLAVEVRQSSTELRDAIGLQLRAMVTGGLYDAVNGGFFRYSTEPTWRNPHYEKMLYNQAQLLQIYGEAYDRFGDALYKWLTGDLVRFLQDWLYQPGQGFYSAIDAESAGVAGGYYLWEADIIDRADTESARAAGLTTYPSRGAEPLKGMLLAKPESSAAETIRDVLLQKRQDRPRPFIDQKILAAWNAAALSGLAAAYRHAPLGERSEALGRLVVTGDELWARLYDPEQDRLLRTTYGGERAVPGTLVDYAFMLAAIIDLYDVSADKRWLQRATVLADRLIDEFLDDSGYFRMTGTRSGARIGTDPVPLYDAELPAADAVALGALWKLWKRQGDTRFKHVLERPLAALRHRFRAEPFRSLHAGRVLADIDLGSIARLQYFAGGKGRVTATASEANETQVCDAVNVVVTLADGWHVNSSMPLQDYLRPTNVNVFKLVDTPLVIDYPPGRVVKLGFQDEALSVYEGAFEIGISSEDCSKWSAGGELAINLQACSDEICLLPEVLRVRLPGFRERPAETAE